MIYIIIIFLLLLFLLAALVALAFSLNSLLTMFRDKVPYVPTPDWAIEWLGKNLHLPDGAVLVDLGCGDARVLIGLKKYLPHVTMIGYDRQWWPWLLAQWRARGTGVTVKRQNFYNVDLSNVDVVFCFLIHAVMPKVETMLKTKLKAGATVYSYGFTFPTWETIDKITNPAKPQGSKINIYKK